MVILAGFSRSDFYLKSSTVQLSTQLHYVYFPIPIPRPQEAQSKPSKAPYIPTVPASPDLPLRPQNSHPHIGYDLSGGGCMELRRGRGRSVKC
jgi:hypothetical protein